MFFVCVEWEQKIPQYKKLTSTKSMPSYEEKCSILKAKTSCRGEVLGAVQTVDFSAQNPREIRAEKCISSDLLCRVYILLYDGHYCKNFLRSPPT